MLICAILWQTCTNGIQYLCYLIQDEAMMGTLEQMFLTKTNFFNSYLKNICQFIICYIKRNPFILCLHTFVS